MVLAHQVIKDDKYRKFFQERKNEGAFIILDNSAFEFGNAIDDKFLLKAISLSSPSEFILPDVLFNKNKTIERVKSFFKKIPYEKINFMAVPQGNDINEWIESYSALITIPQIKSIGIGAIYANKDNFKSGNHLQSGRENIFKQLEKRRILDKNKSYHLLGLGDSGHLEIGSLKKNSYIRSVDSSAAFIHGKSGYLFKPKETYQKRKEKINFNQKYSSENLEGIKHNIRILNDAAR
jgi:hypothetical protein